MQIADYLGWDHDRKHLFSSLRRMVEAFADVNCDEIHDALIRKIPLVLLQARPSWAIK